MTAEPVLVNGQYSPSISVFDRGLMYGDGLFETVHVVKGEVPLWKYHCRRLLAGCKKLHIPVNHDISNTLWHDLQTVVRDAGKLLERCVVKIVITRGEGGRGYRPPRNSSPTVMVICYPYPEYPDDYAGLGVSVSICQQRLSDNPQLAGLKHLNRLDQVLASNELDDSVVDGVMLSQDGAMVESTKANLLFFEDEYVVSPSTKLSGVDGVGREFLFENLSKVGLRGRFDTVLPEHVSDFNGMAIVNSVVGVWPVRVFNGVSLSISPTMRDVQRLFGEELQFESY